MRRNIAIQLLLIMTLTSVKADMKRSDETVHFPFVRQGRILTYSSPSIQDSSDAFLLTYKSKSGEEDIVSGSIVGFEKMIRSEYPEGVSEEVCRAVLPRAYAGCLVTDRTYALVTDSVIKRVKAAPSQSSYSKLLSAPVCKWKDGNWKISIMLINRSGEIVTRMIEGEAAPFMVKYNAECLLFDGIGELNIEKAITLKNEFEGRCSALAGDAGGDRAQLSTK